MGRDVLKIILLHGIIEDFPDMMNLLGQGGYLKRTLRGDCRLMSKIKDIREDPLEPTIRIKD